MFDVEDRTLRAGDDTSADSVLSDGMTVTTFEVKRADPAREGITDVLSMRALARAFAAVISPPRDTFDRALTRTLNVTGSIAAGMQREHE